MGTPEPGRVVVEGFASADFDPFYAEHYGAITRALVLALRRDRLAREAARHAFGRALHQWDSLHTHRHPEGWVFRTALDWARRRAKHHPPLERPTAAATPHPGFHGATDRALSRLDLTDRAVLVLRHHLAWPPADIAAALRLPRLAVAWRLRVALRALSRDAMVPADETETRLAWHLSAAAGAIEASRPPAEAIEGPARRHARWAVAGIVGAVALVFAAIAVLAPGRSRPPDTTAAAGLVVDDPSSEDQGVIFAQPGRGLGWEPAGVPVGTRFEHVVATADGFVAFEGFGPGDGADRVWASPDGGAWSPLDADLSAFGPDDAIYAAAAGGQRIVAVGGPVPDIVHLGPAGDLAVWISEDGAAWQRHDLPVAGVAAQLEPPLGYAPSFARVAVGDAAIVVVADRTLAFDPVTLPAEARALLDEGFDLAYGAAGLEVTDRHGLVAMAIPFEDVAADFAPLLRDASPPAAWAWADGTGWQAATGLDGVIVGGLAATADGFVAAGLGEVGRMVAWTSPDGVTWTETGDDRAIGGWRPVAFGGGLAAVSEDSRVRMLLPGRPGPATVTALPGASDYDPFDLFGGDLGLLGVGVSRPGERVPEEPAGPPTEPVTIERDGRRLTLAAAESTRLTVTDLASGEELLTLYNQLPGAADHLPVDATARTFSVLHPDTGDVLFTAGWDDWSAAWEEHFAALGSRPDPLPAPDSAVWFSPDGRQWSLQPASEAFGAPGYVRTAAVGADAVVAVLDTAGGEPDVFVGRPGG